MHQSEHSKKAIPPITNIKSERFARSPCTLLKTLSAGFALSNTPLPFPCIQYRRHRYTGSASFRCPRETPDTLASCYTAVQDILLSRGDLARTAVVTIDARNPHLCAKHVVFFQSVSVWATVVLLNHYWVLAPRRTNPTARNPGSTTRRGTDRSVSSLVSCRRRVHDFFWYIRFFGKPVELTTASFQGIFSRSF